MEKYIKYKKYFLEKIMKKIYKIYPTWAFFQTLENFWETAFYSTWKYYDYNGREEIFKNAEVLVIWEPVELEYWKYIPNRYFWKIKNMGIVEFKYLKETDKIEIIEVVEVLKWKDLNSEELQRLENCLYKQCHYQNQQNFWNTKTLNVYIEVYKAISTEPKIFFKQKILYDFPFNFDENWDLQEETENKRFFQISENIFYDLEKHLFIKNEEEILFSPYNSNLKQKFLETLIFANNSKISKEKLFEVLGLDNKKLLDLKRSLLNFEFEKYLWLKREFVEKNILIAEKNKGYMLNWNFFENIPK